MLLTAPNCDRRVVACRLKWGALVVFKSRHLAWAACGYDPDDVIARADGAGVELRAPTAPAFEAFAAVETCGTGEDF
jgi:hypothetical protein